MKARILFALMLMVMLATACQAAPAVTEEAPACGIPTPAPSVSAGLPFDGLWVDPEGGLFAVSGGDLYLRYQAEAGLTEQKARVLGYDLEAGTMDIALQEVLVDGSGVGIDDQAAFIRFQADGDQLQYAVQSGEYPADVGTSVYARKLP